MLGFSWDLLSLICFLKTVVDDTGPSAPGGNLGHFSFSLLNPSRSSPLRVVQTLKNAVETAAAEEIDRGGLRLLLLDDFHKLLGKAFAKTAPAFPQLPPRRRRRSMTKRSRTGTQKRGHKIQATPAAGRIGLGRQGR